MSNKTTAHGARETMTHESLEQRVKQLEAELNHLKRDLPNRIEALEKQIVALQKETTKMIESKAAEARTGAETTAQGLVDTLRVEVEKRLAALEKETQITLPALIEEKANNAGTEAKNHAQELVDALIKDRITALETATKETLPKSIETATADVIKRVGELAKAVEGELSDLSNKHKTLSEDVDKLKPPPPAADIAKVRVVEYRAFDDAKLKDAITKERQDVLVEIVSLLDIHNEKIKDSEVFENMLKFLDDSARKFELHAFAGSKVKQQNP